MTGSLNSDQSSEFIDRLAACFETAKDELNALDAAIGDGDHGTTIARGMAAAADAVRRASPKNAAQTFATAGDAFQRASGGAGGLLFAQIFKCVGQTKNSGDLSMADVGAGLAKAVEQISRLGRANPGDKTMIDALAPAAAALVAGGSDTAALTMAVQAAREGAEATKDMAATQGRARYVAGGGRGHIDPGAVSIVMIFESMASIWSDGADSASIAKAKS